jgi:hypothetical protein
MNLADMLCYADIQQLSSIARNYECDCSVHSKNELIQSILSKVNRSDVFEQQVGSLPLEEIRFLNSLVLDSRDLFSLEELIARARLSNTAKQDETWNPRDLISRFRQRGWLFNGYSQNTKYLFQLPNDLKKRFTDTLCRSFKSEIVTTGEPPAYRDEQGLIADDIANLLRYLYNQDVELTADGSIYKRHIQHLLDSLAVPEEPVTKGGWRFGYGRKYRELPARLSFLYDYCYYQGFLAELPGRLSLTDKGRAAVLEGKKEQLADIYRFWLKLYKGPIPNLASIVFWIGRLADGWVTAQSLGSVLCRLIRPYYYDEPASIFENRILPMMMHLGLIRIGEEKPFGKTVTVTRLGAKLISGKQADDEEAIVLPVDSVPLP